MNEHSYRIALIFAVTLHIALVLFLLIKFTSSRSVMFAQTNHFINAVIIDEHTIANQIRLTKEKIVSPQSNSFKKAQLKNILQKRLMLEQAREIAELKKERKMYQKKMAKRQQFEQQMQAISAKQMLAEQQFSSKQSGIVGEQSSGEVNKYQAMIIQAISSQWVYPEGVDNGAVCQLLINVAPGGEVLNVQLLNSSGNQLLDRSAQTAVLKASPLPVPAEPELFNEFRVLKLKFNPKGVLS